MVETAQMNPRAATVAAQAIANLQILQSDGHDHADAWWRQGSDASVATLAPALPSIRLLSGAAQWCDRLAGSWASSIGGDAAGAAIESTAWHLGEMVVLRDAGPARRLDRTASMARADQMDHYQVLVSFSGAGISVTTADGRQLQAARGQPVLIDTAQPADVLLGAGTSVQAFVPREMLEELLPGPRGLHALALTGTPALFLAEHLRSLTSCIDDMAADQAPHAVAATLHMLAAALASTPEEALPAGARHESSLLRQACRYIELHLSEPGLCAKDLCGALKVSRATLYRLFESYGGISAHIRERRLARIHEVLCESSRRPSLARIAEDHGFESAQHFSRVFRRQYGYCPRDAAARTVGDVTRQVAADRLALQPLVQWLRALRG